jgi:hypothetical protein
MVTRTTQVGLATTNIDGGGGEEGPVYVPDILKSYFTTTFVYLLNRPEVW